MSDERKPQLGSIETRTFKTGTSYRAIWRAAGERQTKTFDTYDEACDFLDEMAIALRRGGKAVNANKMRTPFEVVANEWYALRPQGPATANTRSKERGALNGRLAWFNEKPIGHISFDDVQLWINELSEDPASNCQKCEGAQEALGDDLARCKDHVKSKPMRPASVQTYYMILGQVMRYAGLKGYLGPHPLVPVGKGLHTLPDIDGRMIFLTDEESDHLLEVTREQFRSQYAAVHLDAHTGLRQGELFALARENYNPIGKFILVKEAVKGNGHIGTTKTNRWRRVDLHDCCVEVLNEHLAGHDYERVFAAPGGGVWDADNWRRRYWYPIREAAGFAKRGLHFHDLRHSHCSSLLAAGWDVSVVSERLGHSSTKMTLDRYGHVAAGRQQKMVAERGIRAV